MTEAEFYNLLQRYLAGHCTAQERGQVERWYEQLATGSPALPSQNQEAEEDAIWMRLQQAGRLPQPRLRLQRRTAAPWRRAPVRWAAALLLAAGLGAVLPYLHKPAYLASTPLTVSTGAGWTSHHNATQQQQALQLPDGSQVTLHPGSSLRYFTALVGPRREVYLEGEAFFKVHKNPARPFLVFTSQVVTTVLGTSFRVRAYPGDKDASVAVREGKVSVQAREHAQLTATPIHPAPGGVLLLPNQQVVYSVASKHLHKELVDKPVVLIPQAFEFEDRPVAEVLTALEKAYGVHIVYDKAKLAGCTVSITFYNEPLFEKLGLLCKALGAYYQLSDTEIILRGAGC